MKSILVALGRAARSLFRGDVFWHLLWPSVLALVVWTVIAVWVWQPVSDAAFAWVQAWPLVGSGVASSEAAGVGAMALINLALAILLVPLIYVTAALLVAVVALPLMLERVGRTDYADLEQRRGGSNLGSAWNSLLAGVGFLLALLVSLPFWLIPGVGLLATVILAAWLNQRAFGYDALMLHADRAELAQLRDDARPQMLLLGGATALLAFIPLVNLIAPALAGLAFVHLMLEALRQHRLRQGVTVLDAEPRFPSRSTS